MALTSPGVQVTVIDESFFTPAEPGTTPLIVVASAQDKSNSAGTAVASGTLKANAGRAFRMTSQRDLVDTFGVPFFEQTASGAPIHGGERNEYGLLAAYSYLGVSNSAFIVRADIDLAQLEGQARAPGADPKDGQWWVDTGSTSWGIQEWNAAPLSTVGGQRFSNKLPLVFTDDDTAKIDAVTKGPKGSVGAVGDYAVVYNSTVNGSARFFYKAAGTTQFGVLPGEWVLVGSDRWKASHPTVVGGTRAATVEEGNIIINGDSISTVGRTFAQIIEDINGVISDTGVAAADIANRLNLFTNGTAQVGSTTNAIEIGGDESVLESLGLIAGVYLGPELQQSPHTQVPRWRETEDDRPTGSVWIKTTEPSLGSRWFVNRWNSTTESWVRSDAPLYATTTDALFFLDRSGGGRNIPAGSLFVEYDAELKNTAVFRIWIRKGNDRTVITSAPITNQLGSQTITFEIAESTVGSKNTTVKTINVTTTGEALDSETIAAAINAAGFVNVEAEVTAANEVVIFHKTGGDFTINEGANSGTFFGLFAASQNFFEQPPEAGVDWLATSWQPLLIAGFIVSRNAPLNAPVEGQLWYNPEFSEVDLMVHNGNTWVGFNNENGGFPGAEVIVSASQPELTTDQEAVDNHIWISTADLENFPTIYRWTGGVVKEWTLLDNTDQVSEDGVLFADARYGNSGATGNTAAAISALRISNYLDPDAPDPALFPRGMLLWNTRRSGGNVKRYAVGYIDKNALNPRFDVNASPAGETFASGQPMAEYAVDRWVTASGNNEDGSGSFGRKAQRKVVVQAMKSVVDTSFEIRDEERRNFNLIAAPGYTELLSNLINLNLDRGLTAFVIGDVPFRLPSDATSLIRWGTNENLAFDNSDDGIVSFDEYAAVYYPNGFTTDLSGANAVVPSSHMMLRTIALSDNVSFPWFAPAGTRRGGITNATAVGYIDAATGEFQTVSLNEGQRDVLYDLQVNPIPFFVGVGLVAYGQKTRARNASALDRINVARLVVYLRSQLNKLARPYIFEPNDKITRDEVKQAVESLLLELVGLRALFDFAVVCDESNNTPARIDRNELYVDIAIEPVKAVEFIYIPLRVKNTGEI